MRERILAAAQEALRVATAPRFFRTERGYQGRFYCALQEALDARGLTGDGVILEMEYQKSARHDMTQRPDIVLHIPAEDSGQGVRANNFAVFALKWKASRADAVDDFNKLDEMCERLDYPLAIFINVASDQHHRDAYTGRFADRLQTYAVDLVDGTPRLVTG